MTEEVTEKKKAENLIEQVIEIVFKRDDYGAWEGYDPDELPIFARKVLAEYREKLKEQVQALPTLGTETKIQYVELKKVEKILEEAV